MCNNIISKDWFDFKHFNKLLNSMLYILCWTQNKRKRSSLVIQLSNDKCKLSIRGLRIKYISIIGLSILANDTYGYHCDIIVYMYNTHCYFLSIYYLHNYCIAT